MPRPTRPALFLFAGIGWGASTAYMTTALPFLLRRQGLPMAEITALTAIPFLPLSLQPLWAPVLDLGGARRSWFIGTSLLAAVCTVLSTVLQAQGRFTALLYTLLLTNVLYSLASAALNLLCKSTVEYDQQGRAASLLCTGSMMSAGFLGSLLIGLSEPPAFLRGVVHPWSLPALGLLVGGLLVLSALPLWGAGRESRVDAAVDDEPGARQEAGARRAAIGLQLRSSALETLRVLRGREGFLGLLTCLSPVGTAAAANLFGALGPDFHASTGDVALATGGGAALAMAVGALLGGYLADRADRRAVYLLAGALTAACGLGMAVAPATPTTFVVGALAYSVATGLVYATFYPFVFSLLGPAAGESTRYGVFTGAANLAIYYATALEGGIYASGGAGHLLKLDAALNLGGALAVVLLVRLWRPAVAPMNAPP